MKPNQIDEYSKSPRKLGQDDAYNLRGEIKANKATIDQVKNILQLSGQVDGGGIKNKVDTFINSGALDIQLMKEKNKDKKKNFGFGYIG